MSRMILTIWATICAGCAAAPLPPTVTVPSAEAVDERAEPSSISVRAVGGELSAVGLTGSLAPSEVRTALRRHDDAFIRCLVEAAGDDLPHGHIRLGFRVDAQGLVLSVHPSESSIGNVEVERCVTSVAARVRFPTPHGHGEATFSWPLILERPDGARREAIMHGRSVENVIRRHRSSVLQRCRPEGSDWGYQVTAHLSHRGRVLSAGAAVTHADAYESVDCVLAEVRGWRLPSRGRIARVSFALE